MKALTLFRHGKSTWKYATGDLYRPLNGRGLSQTRAMAQSCALASPDLVLCSPADRAYATALIYFHELDICFSRLKLVPQLYDASAVQLQTCLSELADSYNNVWVFAHNPGLQELAVKLLPGFSEPFVTAAYLSVEIDTSRWKNLEASKVVFKVFQKPTA